MRKGRIRVGRLMGLAALAATTLVTQAFALDVSAFYESCFIRNYDTAHLNKHAGQRVTSIMAEIIEWEANPFVRLTYTLRDGSKFSAGGDCYDAIEGGYLCHLCVDESCETGEQTFKVLLKNKDSVTIVNDTTGLTGEDENGVRPR